MRTPSPVTTTFSAQVVPAGAATALTDPAGLAVAESSDLLQAASAKIARARGAKRIGVMEESGLSWATLKDRN
jgi:hypothetical protein